MCVCGRIPYSYTHTYINEFPAAEKNLITRKAAVSPRNGTVGTEHRARFRQNKKEMTFVSKIYRHIRIYIQESGGGGDVTVKYLKISNINKDVQELS